MQQSMVRPRRLRVPLPTDTVPPRVWIITGGVGQSVSRSVGQSVSRSWSREVEENSSAHHLSPITRHPDTHHPRRKPDRASPLTHSAPGLTVVAAAALPQHDATPKVARRHAQLGRERRVVVRPIGDHRPDRRSIAIPAATAARAHGNSPDIPQAEGAPATKLSSRRSGHMPERDRSPSASCAWTVETST